MACYCEAMEMFDREEFWGACMTLDTIWQTDESELCQGLIYLSAGFYHRQAGNLSACRRLLELAVENLSPYAWANRGSQLAYTVTHAMTVTRGIRAIDAVPFDSEPFPRPHMGTSLRYLKEVRVA